MASMKTIDLGGKRFGRLVAQRREYGTKRVSWRCLCDCGRECVVNGDVLRASRQISCGCWRIEQRFRHGGSYTAEYRVWWAMKQRCENPRGQRYPDWGGRGISVCKRWQDFANFFADMGKRPGGLTLDRIDNDGNYEPGNCRWTTPAEQMRNRRVSA